MGVTLPKGWRFVEYDEKTDQMIIKRTKNMASLKNSSAISLLLNARNL
jgi:hypothetical protein